MVPFYLVFNHQSQDIDFSDWISYLTLSLAPLILHILAGVPSPVYLCAAHRPRWHDYITHFNPTSIVWRYFAITDRRARTKSHLWTPSIMAATNALFWTVDGWDGTVQMVQQSSRFRIREPRRTHIGILSTSALATVIVTCQGIQALRLLLGSLAGTIGFSLAFDTVFFPLATFGLLRLPAALWLTDEKTYCNEDESRVDYAYESLSTCGCATKTVQSTVKASELVEESALAYHPMRSWRGIAVRAFFLLTCLLLWVICLMQFIPLPGNEWNYQTSTQFFASLYYMAFLSVTILTLAVYMLPRHQNTTVLPCITSTWYKIYTGTLIVGTLLVFIITALEARKTPCGRLTSLVPEFDLGICGSSTYVYPIDSPKRVLDGIPFLPTENATMWTNRTSPFGLIWRIPNGTFEVRGFDGWCHTGAWQSTARFELSNGTITGS